MESINAAIAKMKVFVAAQQAHLKEEKLTYTQHFHRSVTLSYTFLTSSLKAAIHAVVPSYFTRSSTSTIKQLYNDYIAKLPEPALHDFAEPEPEVEAEVEVEPAPSPEPEPPLHQFDTHCEDERPESASPPPPPVRRSQYA